MTTGREDLRDAVTRWLPGQRWFTAKGIGEPTLTLADVITLSADSELAVLLCFVRAEIGAVAVTYQVPVTVRRRPRTDSAAEATLIGKLPDGWAYDGPHDPRFAEVWLKHLAGRRPTGELTWALEPQVSVNPLAPARVLSGEQSNTSLIIDAEGPTPLIAKLFRVVQPGENPDVEVTAVLTKAGCTQVPRLLGWVSGTGAVATGHLAAISEYLPGSIDAWRLACEAIERSEDFTATARAVGRATAEVHRSLLAACGQVELRMPPVVAGLLDRLNWAVAAVPALAPHAAAARALFGEIGAGARQAQRIHGDLHLGQVLDGGPRGWVLLDFEGEPLRPLADRSRPDLTLRDLAGMLRSFDYAAGHATLGLDDTDPRKIAAEHWATRCRAAFLAGYRAERASDGDDQPLDAQLLCALELDKALYEAVYEARNRPTWLEVPLRAVSRLVQSPGELRSKSRAPTEN